MQYYISELSVNDLILISQILNKPLFKIYCYALTVHNDVVEATCFSFQLNDRWLNITSEWKETPGYINYYELIFKESNQPLVINNRLELASKQMPIPSIMIDRGRKPRVKQLEIYSTKEQWEDEIISYDSHIVFHLENGQTVCLGVLDTIAELMELSTNENYIREMLKDASLRLTLPSTSEVNLETEAIK
jgi:hypothetical protein